MKTIEITDEQFEFLKTAQNLLKTQNTRCTRDPLYTIEKKKRTYGLDPEYASDWVWIWDGESEYSSNEELYSSLIDNGYEDDLQKIVREANGGDCSEFNLKEVFLQELERYDFGLFEDFFHENNIVQVFYIDNWVLDEVSSMYSLFEIDALDYCSNRNEELIHSYACSSWRADRMNKVRDFLTEVNLGE